jgi:hypothetical protein
MQKNTGHYHEVSMPSEPDAKYLRKYVQEAFLKVKYQTSRTRLKARTRMVSSQATILPDECG